MKIFEKFGKKHLLFLVSAIVLIFIFGHVYVLNTEPYLTLEKTLLSDKKITSGLGVIKEVSLKYFGPTKIRDREDTGSADFTVRLSTEKGPVDVKVRMIKHNYQWEIGSLDKL